MESREPTSASVGFLSANSGTDLVTADGKSASSDVHHSRRASRSISAVQDSGDMASASDSAGMRSDLSNKIELSNGSREVDMANGGQMNEGQRVQYLEQSIQFLRNQHQELVSSLHDEVDHLKRKNRELQFCIVMMQQSMRTQAGTRRTDTLEYGGKQHTNVSNARPSDGLEDVTAAGVDEEWHISDKKLDELKVLFLEEEIKDLRKRLEEEKIQNQQFSEKLRTSERQLAVERLKSMSLREDNTKLSSSFGVQRGSEMADGANSSSRSTATGLPFSATVDPLLVHFPPHPPRPPTLQECQSIVKHLYFISSQQAHELKQLKLDLHDVLYSHKWTPDAYLLARAYIADQEEPAIITNKPLSVVSTTLPRIPMKHVTRKIPSYAYQTKDAVSLSAMKPIVGTPAIERQKRTQLMQKIKSVKQ